MSDILNPLTLVVPAAVVVGPRGGDPQNPDMLPAAREAAFNGNLDPDHGTLRFHNSKPKEIASKGHVEERPWHRMAAYMLVAGRTNTEIAIAAGVHVSNISHLRVERWFQELCATIANTEGQEIVGLINSEVANSIEKIVSIRDNEEAPLRLQLAAAVTLLEQGHGKPKQQIIASRGPNVLSPEEEMQEVTRELANLEKNRLTQGIQNGS